MPQHFHAERIVVLHKLVENTGWDGTTSLHAPFVYEKLTGYHRSLRDELISFPLDESLVEELLSITWHLTLQRRAQLTACLAVAKLSPAYLSSSSKHTATFPHAPLAMRR